MSELHPNRRERALERTTAFARVMTARTKELARNPVRLLVGAVCVALIVVSVPLLASGGRRLERAWSGFRHDRSVNQHWIPSRGTVVGVRDDGGLELRLTYRDRGGTLRTADVRVDTVGSDFVKTRLLLRYDPRDRSQVELVGIDKEQPLGSALVAGAAIGAGLAALVLAIGIWRRRKLISVSARPLSAIRAPLTLAGMLLAVGLGAWAVGTVSLQGVSGVANRIGDAFATVFGDFLGVLVPVLAFVAGCLVTAWLARHRHHDEHEGPLSSAHRFIDRVAGYAPSPDDLAAPEPDPGPAPAEAQAAAPMPEPEAVDH